MRKTSLEIRVGVVLALGLAGALMVESCGGGEQSLIVVALTAIPPDPDLKTVVIDIDTVSKSFSLSAGLSGTVTSFGVYVPSSVKGNVLVTATARHMSAKDCNGYRGSGRVMIDTAGSTKNVIVPLAPADVCATTGTAGAGAAGTSAAGTAGTNGTAGTGTAGSGTAGTGAAGTMGAGGRGGTGGGTAGTGAAGTGAAGTGAAGTGAAGTNPVIVPPPSLTKCTEYDHIVGTCTEGGVGDWAIWSVAFSPDGKTLLTAGEDGRVKLWKVTGATIAPDGRVLATDGQGYVAFSPDGTMVVAGSHNGQLTLYNTSNWGVRRALNGLTATIYGVGFSPDSKQVVAIDSAAKMMVWSIDSSAAVRLFDLPSAGWALGVSPVRTATEWYIGVGYSDGTGELLNLGVMPSVGTFMTIDSSGSESVAFAPDGKLAATGGDDGIATFWKVPPVIQNLPTGPEATPFGATIKTLSTNGLAQAHNGMAFSPDGRHIAIATGSLNNGGRLGIWDVATRQTRGAFLPTYYPYSVAWAPAGNVLVGGEAACGKVAVCAD